MPAHDWITTSVAGFGLACALCVCFMSFLVAHDYLSGRGGARASRLSAGRITVFVLLLGSVWAVGLERTTLDRVGWLARADLREAQLTPRPDDWKPFELWLRDYRQERDGKPTEQDLLIPTKLEMQRYRLWLAGLDAPILRERDLQGARMIESFLPGADLRGAKMQGADLRGAKMQDSECARAALLAALAHSADLTCRTGTLTQSQLSWTVGNRRTVLPPGLWVWSCLDRAAPELQDHLAEIDAVVALHPEEGRLFRISRSAFEERLFCGPEDHAFKITYDPFERRFWKDFNGIR